MTARPFEQTVDVETPELVVLTYSLAGVGSRVLAGLTDLVICVASLLAVGAALLMLRTGGGWLDQDRQREHAELLHHHRHDQLEQHRPLRTGRQSRLPGS